MAESCCFDPTTLDEKRLSALQINPKNGMSHDYWNEFFVLFLSFDVGMVTNGDGISNVRADLCERPIRLYEERFPPDTYPELYNIYTAPLIQELNALVLQLRTHAADQTLTTEELAEIFNSAAEIIGQSPACRWPVEYRSSD